MGGLITNESPKEDVHVKTYYNRIIQLWSESPFILGETPQMWLKKSSNKALLRPERSPSPFLETAPPSDGSYYLYVLRAEGSRNFTGFGVTTTPLNRVKRHLKKISTSNSTINSFAWFKLNKDNAKKLEGSIKRNFPVCSQQIESFKTEATSYEMHSEVISFVDRFMQTFATASTDEEEVPIAA